MNRAPSPTINVSTTPAAPKPQNASPSSGEPAARMGQNGADQEEAIALLEAMGRGEAASFEEFHTRYAGVVFSTVYKVLHNPQDAEDVAQEVFAQIWRKADQYRRDRGKPLTWVVTMARNRAIDHLRSKQRRFRLRDEFEEEAKTHDMMTRVDASQEASVNEAGSLLRSAVMQLSNEQREAIELAFFSGMTQNEIANNLGQPLGTIKARIRRGMHKLRTKVETKL